MGTFRNILSAEVLGVPGVSEREVEDAHDSLWLSALLPDKNLDELHEAPSECQHIANEPHRTLRIATRSFR